MLGNKGQGAMEYLMTYGWAILVVMVVGIAMWQLGLFKPNSAMTATGFSKIKPQLSMSGLAADGVIQTVFTNGVGSKLTIDPTAVVFTDGGSVSCSPVGGVITVDAGDNFQLSASGCDLGDSGEYFIIDVTIPYTTTLGTISTTHQESGTIKGSIE